MRAVRCVTSRALARSYSRSARACAVIPFNLTDIGEGIQEVEIIEWFIEAGADIKQFDRVCEVQSDKVRCVAAPRCALRRARRAPATPAFHALRARAPPPPARPRRALLPPFLLPHSLTHVITTSSVGQC